ncbi:hypothetical protein K1T71_010010 [Dendrolimus kikuchii]|uniref:Uncharacterized protein n=1 Tax=Dendrolimus kikuchii TaxID=765133 RepID=A0ACC1CTG1_9NEOP|nr:hypothetical protein K1T71_010010 [Dendrolimus kikuchii]
MRDDINFCIEFIKEVEGHPCLYDHQHIDYGNARQIQIAWKKIATKLNENDLNCRRKWKMIRSSYIRSFHYKSKSGSVKKDYYLSPYLQFLRPFAKPKLQDAVADASDDGSSGRTHEDRDDCDDDADSDAEASHEGRLPPKRKRAATEPMFVTVKREEGGPEEDAPEAERDPCQLYLLSLAPHIRAMSLRQQLQFQRGVIDLIEQIKYGE